MARGTTRFWVWIASVAVVLACVLPVGAQGRTPIIDDPDRLFGDGTAVRNAANRLAAEGADVVVIAVRDAGRDTTSVQQYLNRRLNELNLASQYRSLRGSQIVFFLAPQPGFQGLYYVSSYRSKLDPVYRSITTDTMQPLFTRGEYADGMVAGIDAVTNTLNPPVPRTVPIILISLAVLVVLAIIGVFVARSRASANVRTTARQRADEARRRAGIAIADLGRRMSAAREQAQFDKVSYGDADAQRLATIQQRGERAFAQAQSVFDAAEEQMSGATLAPKELNEVAAQFDDAVRLVGEATAPIEEAEQRRITLDRAVG